MATGLLSTWVGESGVCWRRWMWRYVRTPEDQTPLRSPPSHRLHDYSMDATTPFKFLVCASGSCQLFVRGKYFRRIFDHRSIMKIFTKFSPSFRNFHAWIEDKKREQRNYKNKETLLRAGALPMKINLWLFSTATHKFCLEKAFCRKAMTMTKKDRSSLTDLIFSERPGPRGSSALQMGWNIWRMRERLPWSSRSHHQQCRYHHHLYCHVHVAKKHTWRCKGLEKWQVVVSPGTSRKMLHLESSLPKSGPDFCTDENVLCTHVTSLPHSICPVNVQSQNVFATCVCFSLSQSNKNKDITDMNSQDSLFFSCFSYMNTFQCIVQSEALFRNKPNSFSVTSACSERAPSLTRQWIGQAGMVLHWCWRTSTAPRHSHHWVWCPYNFWCTFSRAISLAAQYQVGRPTG